MGCYLGEFYSFIVLKFVLLKFVLLVLLILEGAGFSAWLRTFTTDLPLTPHPLLDGVDSAKIHCENAMYRGMFVSGCEAVIEKERQASEN